MIESPPAAASGEIFFWQASCYNWGDEDDFEFPRFPLAEVWI
jgi:hypothetical protein